jgi:hypothetical protein
MAGRFKLRVHEPCSQPWGSMAGDDRRRFCGRCSLHVHDLSAMREEAVMKLIAGPDPHLCIRYSVRDDGTAIIGESRAGRWLRGAGLIAMSFWFWATVVLVQLPWLALTRRTVPPPSASPGQQAERDRKEIDLKRRASEERARLMAAIKGESDRGTIMGGMPRGERHHVLLRDVQDRQQHSKKTRR